MDQKLTISRMARPAPAMAGRLWLGLGTAIAGGVSPMTAHSEAAVVHRAVGAGRWFPGDRDTLRRMVDGFIDNAEHPVRDDRIVAALAPHAGFVYSGAVAGYVYRALRDARPVPDVAIVLGFSHRQPFPGVAVLDGATLSTPLGNARLAGDSAARLTAASPRIRFDAGPHRGEHAAENQVPFLQAALPDTPLVVALVGDHDPATIDALATAVADLSADRHVVVIASTDLLHDPDYERVTRTDRLTLARITALDDRALIEAWRPQHQICCGLAPVLTAIRIARDRGCRRGELLHYRNSGDDVPESRGNWVVGYGAVVFRVEDE